MDCGQHPQTRLSLWVRGKNRIKRINNQATKVGGLFSALTGVEQTVID